MLNNTGFWSALDFLSEEPARMLLYNIGSWSAGAFISEEPGPRCYITLDPDQIATLYQKNRAIILLYNNGSLSAGDLIPEEPGQHDAI